jgi:hypothetical protein
MTRSSVVLYLLVCTALIFWQSPIVINLRTTALSFSSTSVVPICSGAGGDAASRRGLLQIGSPSDNPCVVFHALEGRTGNYLLNYFVARLYAEIHGCASAPVTDFGGDMGGEAFLDGMDGMSKAWPPAPTLPLRDGAQTVLSDSLFEVFTEGRLRAMALGMQFERADILYSAASLGWMLGNATLAGAPHNGRGQVLLSYESVRSRCRAWASARDACAGDEHGAALHPWLPRGARALAVKSLSGQFSADAPEGLKRSMQDPEGTLVVHIRLGDMSAMAWQEVRVAERVGHSLEWNASERGAGWEWAPEHFPHYQYPEFPDCNKLREVPAYSDRNGDEMIEALESDVARLGGFTVAPLSFYVDLFQELRPRSIVLLTEKCSVDHPIVRALKRDYNAVVQTGSVAEDFATMILARRLVISGSTFSYAAALVGRARSIYVPYAGAFSLFHAHNKQCLTPARELDDRFVFYDTYRRAVDNIALKLAGDASRFVWRVAGSGALPMKPKECPSLRTNTLNFDELIDFYRNPACAGYYYPPATADEARLRSQYETQFGKSPVCPDAEWTFFRGTS